MPPITYSTIDELRNKLELAEKALSYDIEGETEGGGAQAVKQPAPILDRPESVSYEQYAEIAEQSYQKDRVDTKTHNYLGEFSSPDYAVYQNDLEYVIGIRGSSPNEPVRDFVRDTQVALGSVSTLSGINPLGTAIVEVGDLVKKLKERDDGKSFHVTGHSLGGSIASYFGVDNPDVDVTTFNKGEGLPFISDAIKCSISGCRNIKNYRISGDFASLGSKFGNIGEYQSLRPVRPTEKVREEAQLAGGFFIEPELYLPHSLSNFIGREGKVEMNSNIYARPLAAKIGRVAGAILPIIGGAVYSRVAKKNLFAAREEAYGDAVLYNDEEGIQFAAAQVTRDYDQLVADQTTSFKETLNFGGTSFLGRSAGELAGLAFYEKFLASEE